MPTLGGSIGAKRTDIAMILIDREDFELFREIENYNLVVVYDEGSQASYYIQVTEEEKKKSNEDFYRFVCNTTAFPPEYANVRRYWVDEDLTELLQSKNI